MSDHDKKVPRRIAQTILNSLKGGVVPRIGLPYITVGRKMRSRPCCMTWISSQRVGLLFALL